MSNSGTKKIMFTKNHIDDLCKQLFNKKCVVLMTRIDIENSKKMILDNTTKADGNTSKNKTPEDNNVVKQNINISIDKKHNKKKRKLGTNRINILKLEFRDRETHQIKKVKSSLKSDKKIASISSKEVPPLAIDCVESTTSVSSSTKNIESTIRVIDARTMIDGEDQYIKYLTNFESFLSDQNSKPLTNGMNKLAVTEPSTSGLEASFSSAKIDEVKQLLNDENHVKWNFNEIQKLHQKYFTKYLQVTIVVISNILNVISISNENFKSRVDESSKIRSKVQKIKERRDVQRLHERCNKILETKLKNIFIAVTRSFIESEFYLAFIMFFTSILTVLRGLNQSKFGDCQELFEIVQKLISESLMNNEYYHSKIFSMFQLKTFHFDCKNVIKVIIDSRDTDHGVTNRMPLYFLRDVNSLEYFKAVIKVVTGDSNEDLSLLIENAIFKCYYNSESTVHVGSLFVEHSNHSIPVTKTIQSSIHSDETRILAKNQYGTNHDIPVLNGNKSQVIGSSALEPLIAKSQPLTSFSCSLQKKTSEVIPTKICIDAMPTTISNSSLVQVTPSSSNIINKVHHQSTPTTTCGTFRHSIQNNNFVANSYHHNVVDNNIIVIDNEQYRLFKEPSGQLRAVIMNTISNSPLMHVTASLSETAISTPTPTACQSVRGPSSQMRAVDNDNTKLVKSPSNIITRCYYTQCNNPVKYECKCGKAKYCSESCRASHWMFHYAVCN